MKILKQTDMKTKIKSIKKIEKTELKNVKGGTSGNDRYTGAEVWNQPTDK